MDLKRLTPSRVLSPSEDAVAWERPRAGATLPVVIEPTAPGVDLVEWSRRNVERIDGALLDSSAILFRGFDVTASETLESFASAFFEELYGDNGEHPKASVNGHVYTPVFFPPEERLLWHNENSFNASGPAKIWFCCQKPAESGGETPIVDSRTMLDRLPERIKTPFIEKGVMYVRNYGGGLGLDWREVFRTTDRRVVEERCERDGLRFEWHGGRLRTSCVRPAVIRHPRTGRRSWFNQAQHWHISCLNDATRSALLATFDEDSLPRACYYGDGSPIADGDMAEICRHYADLEVVFPWRRGDVLMVDNILAAHGRNPFTGQRKLLVAMGGMTDYQ
jgi:alpha-ketoglutarate-dependent taurine dioxygenase